MGGQLEKKTLHFNHIFLFELLSLSHQLIHTTMFKYSTRTLLKATSAAARPTGAAASIGAIRTKYSLPELDYKLDALEPHISGQINDLHYNVCTIKKESIMKDLY